MSTFSKPSVMLPWRYFVVFPPGFRAEGVNIYEPNMSKYKFNVFIKGRLKENYNNVAWRWEYFYHSLSELIWMNWIFFFCSFFHFIKRFCYSETSDGFVIGVFLSRLFVKRCIAAESVLNRFWIGSGSGFPLLLVWSWRLFLFFWTETEQSAKSFQKRKHLFPAPPPNSLGITFTHHLIYFFPPLLLGNRQEEHHSETSKPQEELPERHFRLQTNRPGKATCWPGARWRSFMSFNGWKTIKHQTGWGGKRSCPSAGTDGSKLNSSWTEELVVSQ